MMEAIKEVLTSDLVIYFLKFLEYFLSMVIGSCFSFIFAFANNCTLFEIYKNIFYALYFAFFFIILGFIVLSKSYRSYVTKFQHPDFIKVSKGESFRFKYTSILGVFLIFSALFSLFIHIGFIQRAHYLVKVPFFCVIGIGIVFSLAVFTIDLINLLHSLVFYGKNKPPLFNYQKQILYVIYISAIMGVLFSFVFAMLDTEDVSFRNIENVLRVEQNFLIPIGLILGSASGICAVYYNKEDEGDISLNDNDNNSLSNNYKETYKPVPIKVEEV